MKKLLTLIAALTLAACAANTMRSDSEVASEIDFELDRYNLHNVAVEVRDRDVYLTGMVDSPEQRDLAYAIAARTPNIDEIIDDVRVS